jgi:hypothetical protein
MTDMRLVIEGQMERERRRINISGKGLFNHKELAALHR